MMSRTATYFLRKTHIQPDYILLEILKVLGIDIGDDFGIYLESTMAIIDEDRNIIGKIITTSEGMIIKKV